MKCRIFYDKTLKMSQGKVAAQCCHVAKELGRLQESDPKTDVMIVLGLSHTKFLEAMETADYIQRDAGHTEVAENTPTACGSLFP